MEELQTDTLSDYGKNPNPENTSLESSKDNENGCAESTLLNGCDEIDDPLDLMDHCDNESIGSNSDVWKGSDSEEESFENKDNPHENIEINKDMMDDTPPKITDTSHTITETPPEDDGNVNKSETTEDENKCDDNNHKPVEDSSVMESEDQNIIQQSENGDHLQQKHEKLSDESEKNLIDNNIESKNNDNIGEKELQRTNTEKQNISDSSSQKEDSSVVSGQEKTASTTSEKKGDSKKNTNVEENKNPPEIDPLNTDTPEIAPLNTNSSKVDPLNTNTPETDPLNKDNSDTSEKNPSVDRPSGESQSDCAKEKDSVVGDMEKLESRRPDRNNDGQDDDESQIDYNDDDDDDDFDPSLLCPEVSMAVDENPVITNSGPVPNDGNSSPLPYEPVFSTYVDEVTGAEISFNLTAEEQELRKRLYGPTNPIQISKIHCTACNVHLGSALEGQNNRFVHPLLKVLICKECYHFYTSGEFEKDEDGSELYCRWCGQGGQVLCCSKCEYVFCKRCIRTNFGRKKMFEIRDSDSWDCFRCVPSQIITQRVACYEFFEYIRREMGRAMAISNTEAWSRDHSRCCLSKKRSLENGEEVKRKKKRGEADPDYNPILDTPVISSPQPSSSISSSTPVKQLSGPKGIILPKPIQIVPKFNKPKDNDIEFVKHIPAPQVVINPVRACGSVTGYRAILPTHVRPVMQPPTLVRINSQPLPPLLPTGNRLLNNALQGKSVNTSNMMKHEWFEKTVRAAARVNSHLSYTLTQLNKAQSQAASVEELAVVHNKLQEILSSSINSLIQIRKNLRTEFIAGIKTVRLPSKKVESFTNDDDVIFVSAPSPAPSTSQTKTVPNPIIIVDNSSKLATSSNSTKPASETAVEKPKSYLKVKSVRELQNVPSECITIPDDTPVPPPVSKEETSEVVSNGIPETPNSTNKSPNQPKIVAPELSPKISTPESIAKTELVKKCKVEPNVVIEPIREIRTRRSREIRFNKLTFNVKSEPTPEIKRMMSVTVNLARVDLEELQKRLPNGCH